MSTSQDRIAELIDTETLDLHQFTILVEGKDTITLRRGTKSLSIKKQFTTVYDDTYIINRETLNNHAYRPSRITQTARGSELRGIVQKTFRFNYKSRP
jgi:hypothetical protein